MDLFLLIKFPIPDVKQNEKKKNSLNLCQPIKVYFYFIFFLNRPFNIQILTLKERKSSLISFNTLE